MAIRYAAANGNWSDPATWVGGTLPEPGDSVHASTRTVTIDQDIEVERISTAANAPAAAGGGFVISSIPPEGRFLNCDIRAGTTPCLSVTANGDLRVLSVYGGTSTGSIAITFSGSGKIEALDVSAGAASAHGISTSTATEVVARDVVAGATTGHGIVHNGSGIITVRNVTGSTASTGTGVTVTLGATVIANNVTGLNGPGISAVHASAVVDILGEVRASNATYGANVPGSANVRVRGPLYNAPNNRVAIYCQYMMIPAGEPFYWEVRDDTGGTAGGAPVMLSNVHEDSPPPSEVRKGVIYGPGNNLVGTLDIPDPSAVAIGVPVDDTVGTAAVDVKGVAAITGAQIAVAIGA